MAANANALLTNIRIRNSSSTSRNDDFGINIGDKIGVELDDIEIEDFSTGIDIASDPDNPTRNSALLTNIRVRNSSSTSRNAGQAIKLTNLQQLEASDAIMVARGDLGVDIPLERVPLVQKEVIRKCNQAGKPVITATEMLESMVSAIRPTRAETTDVANAIYDGSDATMLSAETSVGKYPVQAVRMMARIARETERRLPYKQMLLVRGNWLKPETDDLISYDAAHIAQRLGAAAVVAFTQSGSTAERLAKYRPGVPVLAITPNPMVPGRLMLCWGVYPYQVAVPSSVDELFATAARLCRELGLAKPGDLVVITGGVPIGVAGSTNLLKVERIGQPGGG